MSEIPERLNREQVVRLVLDRMSAVDHWALSEAIVTALDHWDGMPATDIDGRRRFLTGLPRPSRGT